jgi:hypothetical protein
MEENLGCIAIAEKLTDENIDEINVILGNNPESWMGYGAAGARQLKTI